MALAHSRRMDELIGKMGITMAFLVIGGALLTAFLAWGKKSLEYRVDRWARGYRQRKAGATPTVVPNVAEENAALEAPPGLSAMWRRNGTTTGQEGSQCREQFFGAVRAFLDAMGRGPIRIQWRFQRR